MKNNDIKTMLESIIFDLETVKRRTKEEYTYKTLDTVISNLNKIKREEDENLELNFVKRITYQRMKQYQTSEPDKSKKLYELYQKLKKGDINAEEGLTELLQYS